MDVDVYDVCVDVDTGVDVDVDVEVEVDVDADVEDDVDTGREVIVEVEFVAFDAATVVTLLINEIVLEAFAVDVDVDVENVVYATPVVPVVVVT